MQSIRTSTLVFLALAVSGWGVAGAATMPLGIPDPSGTVPDAIMPTLPAANSQMQAFPYDPIETPTPTWNDGDNQYYVDNRGACSDTANGGRGSPSEPRCTLPGLNNANWDLSAGDQLFIVGDGATYGDDRHLESVRMPGTASAPVWIIGVGDVYPELRFMRFFWRRGSHVFFEYVHFRSPDDNFRMTWNNADGPVEYFTFRNLKCSGSDGTNSDPSRRCFSVGGNSNFVNRFMVFHNLEVWGLGRWQDDRVTGRDLLGFQMQKWSRYIWILNSEIYHIQGDSVMCGNSNWWDYNYASRPHYIYIGGNEMYENYENAYDQKGCYHMVFSENYVHDFYNSQKSANETAIITEQDSEGDVGGRYSWFLNNTVRRAGTAFGSKATTDDAYIYILGNVVSEIRGSALLFTQRCYSGGSAGTTCPFGLTFAHNTVDCGLQALAIDNPQNPTGSDQRVEIDSNIFYNCRDGGNGTPHDWESFAEEPLFIVHTQNAHYRTSGGNIRLPTNRLDEISGNSLNDNVRFVAAAQRDYTLQVGSSAEDLVREENAAYNLFQSFYNIDIRRDINGNPWSAMPINAGAVQEAGAMLVVRPNPPIMDDPRQ